ncbi:hypothetical protein UFOVP35_49 [uncultured Caudovirales phage]|uniref:rRNA biogenesis protein rrp5 n=1 Tax=uncultured Caudovirales phage TaxID=2100421 RepID=A0A6J5KR03_9CAUD|nr:hypothetical protein UFOVP35_49 [uncultured Caudovirales phage]CAB4125022.1 hypothetical protein UFOVP52_74 [uncultured Caudovirales phage]CAB5219815.1 hypothetical protein UFOVP234_22 [uncultured Caudovirales phage]
MNLELAIQKNTESIESLTFVIQQLITALAAAEPVEISPEPIVTAPEPVVTAPIPEPEPVVITTVITPPTKKEVTYSEVAKKITTVFQIDRMAVVNALAKFGAAKGPELKPEDYAAFMSELS